MFCVSIVVNNNDEKSGRIFVYFAVSIDVNNEDEKSGRIFVCFAVSNEVDSCTLAGVSISLSSSLKNEKMILNVVQYFFWKQYVGSDNIIRKYSQNSDQFQQVVYLMLSKIFCP